LMIVDIPSPQIPSNRRISSIDKVFYWSSIIT
jgi:hypothetical protein